MSANEKDLNAGMEDALRKRREEDQVKEDERKARLLGTGTANKAANAIIERKKALAEATKGI